MAVKLLTEHHFEFLSFKGGCTGWSESTIVKEITCRGSINCVLVLLLCMKVFTGLIFVSAYHKCNTLFHWLERTGKALRKMTINLVVLLPLVALLGDAKTRQTTTRPSPFRCRLIVVKLSEF